MEGHPPSEQDTQSDAVWIPSYAVSDSRGPVPRLARTAVSGRATSAVGLFDSPKNRAALPWDSMLERDWFAVLETDSMVSRFHPQPGMLRYTDDDDRARRYFPDVLVEFFTQPAAVIEIKPRRRAEQTVVVRKHLLIRTAFSRIGLRFAVVTESAIRRQPRFMNARRLLEFRTAELPDASVAAAQIAFRGSCPPTTLGQLERALGGSDPVKGWSLSMALRGIIKADLDAEPLCAATAVQWLGCR
jgi:hypothetical protein